MLRFWALRKEPDPYFTEYGRSKSIAEKMVLASVEKCLSPVVLCHTRAYGPSKMTQANAATRAISLCMRGRLSFMLGSANDLAKWVYLEDIALGHLLAAEKEEPGNRYITGGENASLRDVYQLGDEITGIKHAKIPIPEGVALPVGAAEELRAKVLGTRPHLSEQGVWLFRSISSAQVDGCMTQRPSRQ